MAGQGTLTPSVQVRILMLQPIKEDVMAYDQNFMDALALVSFVIGVANYNENLSQSDKDDMMQALDEKTNRMLVRLEADLEEQNEMLRQILIELKGTD